MHNRSTLPEGKDIANPMAMILALAALLSYVQSPAADKASRAIYESVFEAIHSGLATVDLHGQLGTVAFTDEIIARVAAKLEVWSAL